MRVEAARAKHYDVVLARTRNHFIEIRGVDGVPGRTTEIAALPSKIWNGVRVHEVRCEGPFGRGPHGLWVPEYVLWSLIDPSHFTCPFHR